MPTLQGFETRTHLLPGGREIDILHRPDQPRLLWTPGPQIARLTDDGRRANGQYSTSDAGRYLDPEYRLRVPDPHRIYSPTRVRSVTLFAVEGLILKAFHTTKAAYIKFCYEFIERVLSAYVEFAAHNAELIMSWYEALEHFDVTGNDLNEATFRDAVNWRNTRLTNAPDIVPVLVIGTVACEEVVCIGEAHIRSRKIPLADDKTPLMYEVAQLHDAHVLSSGRRKHQPAWSPTTPHLALRKPSGAILLYDGTPIVPTPQRSPEPLPEQEPPENPLPGVPAVFMDVYQCPVFGTYEDPEWIGLYVCDALGHAKPHQALSRIPAEEKGLRVVGTPGGPQSHVTLKEPGLYRLISTSRKDDAERFRKWIFREVLPAIRKYGHYTAPGGKTAPTAEYVREALRAIMRDELPKIVEPIVIKAVRAHSDHVDLAELIKTMAGNFERLGEIVVIGNEQLALSRQSIDLVTPSHQLFLSASDYVEMDGVADALKRAPKLAEPSFGLDHCPDYGKGSLWMKRLCRAENKKVAANAVARIIAKDAGQEEPPLYIPEFRMKRLEREHAKVLMFNPACWARLKQTFLPADTPTLLFPGPKAKAPKPDVRDKNHEA